ncbi:hypothetical protein TVAG_248510 [Trichomonas vaginalis G3]|uniref:Uncharacterized protein n=1 Tax=Trichomonas vaginalis (strain ATCC PRA-98 / G3) TaxID=412133 RepID=A2E787_TRIV3|nr:hypothetical protein TVAGG3_0283770 [Trichomonas vaginalis G3]EAY11484.1 hypothetical protein TVAG_248510 [Trichomonas vaginalis G3]KAI5526754.1 hypothetical protein TVAGG3_0283770 [Trichomonas vaginalis G3]|eukprot:XP_001323707.1 hypothetical protein [Trichomonas vaginalis G3]
MDGVKFALSSIIALGEKLKISVSRIRNDKSPDVIKNLQNAINEFDSKIYNFQELVPKTKVKAEPTPTQVTQNLVEGFEHRKEKVYSRYSEEITQINQRYKNLRKQIVSNTEQYCNKVFEIEEKFKADIEKMENERDQEIERRRSIVDAQIKQIDDRLRPIKKEFKIKTQAKIEEVNQLSENTYNHWQESIATTKQAIIDVDKEYAEKEEFFITSEQDIINGFNKKCAEIRDVQDVEINKIIDEKNDIKKLIHREKDKVLSLKDRENMTVQAYHSNYTGMVAKLSKHHTTQMKILEIKIADAKQKAINLTKTYNELTQKFSSEILVNTNEVDDAVQEVLDKRPKLVDDAIKEKTAEFLKQIELLESKVSSLQAEINSNIKEANEIVSRVHKEMNDRLNQIQDANDKEVRELSDEITKIVQYKSKIEGEEKTLKDSTEIIFQSQLNNLNFTFTAMKRRHAEEIETVTAREKPVEEFIDYDKLLEDEINKIDTEYRQEEAAYEKEKSVLLGVKAEEDKSRGYLETRKQNAPEITSMKETADELKTKLHDVTLRADSGKAASASQLESDKKALEMKLNATIAQIERQHQDKMNMLRKEKEAFQNQYEKTLSLFEETEKSNNEAKVRAKLADEMNARIPEQMKEEAKKKREELLETYKDQAFDVNKKLSKLEAQKKEVQEKTETTVKRAEYLRQQISQRKMEYENTLNEGIKQLEHEYEVKHKEQDQIIEKMRETYKQNKDSLLNEIIDRSKSADALLEKVNKIEKNSEMDIQRLIEGKIDELTEEHMKKQNERRDILSIETKKLQTEIDNVLFEIKKEKNWKTQDNRMLLTRKFEEMEKEMKKKSEEVDKLNAEIEKLKVKLDSQTNSPCKNCPKVAEEIEFVKKDILDIVTKMQSLEAEETNRNFIATHFGTKSLPPLKT